MQGHRPNGQPARTAAVHGFPIRAGKAETAIEFAPGGTITKINSKTEGQIDDVLKIPSAVMGAAGMRPAVDGGAGSKCKPTVGTYLISYDAAGRPSVDLTNAVFVKVFDAQ